MTHLIVDFSKTVDSLLTKDEQILPVDGLHKENVRAIMMFNENTKVKVCSPDGKKKFSDIVAGVLQGYTLAPYIYSNVDRSNESKWF